jgi:hypothetical protein
MKIQEVKISGSVKKYICKSCNNIFESKKGCKSRTPTYCSKKCHGESMKLTINCKLCGIKIENTRSSKISNRIYCSKKCQGESRKGVKLSDEWRLALSNARKNSDKCKGSNLYNWKGGYEAQRIRNKTAFYRRKNLKKSFDYDYLSRLIKSQNNKCFFCNSDLTNYKAIEHLTPITRGGDNDNYNLVYSCKSCNSKKRQQTLEEFAIKTRKLYWLDKFDYIYASTIL